MNKLARFIALLVGSSGIAATGSPSDAIGSPILTEQAACEEALRQNTIEALEEFLRKYPQGDSACRALALNSLASFEPSQKGSNSNKGELGGFYGG